MEKRTKKLERMASDFKRNKENITESISTFTKSLEKLKSYLETTNKMTLIGSLSNYPLEMQKFKDDLNGYGLGIFLWFNDEYSHISDVYDQCGFLPSVIKIKDIKKCIDEYKQLIDDAKQKDKALAELELEVSQELFNNTHLNPIKNLTMKSHLWRKIDENTAIYIDVFVKTQHALEIYIDVFSKIVRSEMTRYKVMKGRRGGKNLFKLTKMTFTRINKEFYKKCPTDIIEKIQDLSDSGNEITIDLDYIKEHKKEEIYNLLELNKDFYEFHIDLVKYILRLWHISEYGNQDYVNNYKIKHEFPNINRIVNFYIKQKLAQNYPKLSRVLTGFFLPYAKYRHIESHSSPNLELSADEKHILIPQKGKKTKLKVDISDFQTFIRTYQSFIEALGIYR